MYKTGNEIDQDEKTGMDKCIGNTVRKYKRIKHSIQKLLLIMMNETNRKAIKTSG